MILENLLLNLHVSDQLLVLANTVIAILAYQNIAISVHRYLQITVFISWHVVLFARVAKWSQAIRKKHKMKLLKNPLKKFFEQLASNICLNGIIKLLKPHT